MKATEVISTLKARGIELWQEGNALRYRAPSGVLTEREKTALKAHKPAILRALSQPTALPENRAVTEPVPSTEPATAKRTRPWQWELPAGESCETCHHFNPDRWTCPHTPFRIRSTKTPPCGGNQFAKEAGTRGTCTPNVPPTCTDESVRRYKPVPNETPKCRDCRRYASKAHHCHVLNVYSGPVQEPACGGKHFQPKETRS